MNRELPLTARPQAAPISTPPTLQPVPVWDWLVRLGHLLLAGSVLFAFATGESERWRLWHVLAGSTAGVYVLVRLLWGFCGTRPARFASFVRGPQAVIAYLSSLLQLHPQQHTGHNPAGGWAILGLLGLTLLTTASGAFTYWEGFGWLPPAQADRLLDACGEVHEGLAATLISLVLVHVAGVVIGSFCHGENLVRAMLTGTKLGRPQEQREHRGLLGALLLLLLLAGVLTWIWLDAQG